MAVDDAKDRLDELLKEFPDWRSKVFTEADTRFQFIDRMLVDVLGWHQSRILLERNTDSGFSDYLAEAEQGSQFIIEAKKSSKTLVDSVNRNQKWYKASSVALKSAQDGMAQAQRYCVETGTTFCAITNGHQWIGYWAVRNDGKPPREGKVPVFKGLDDISESFALFYELFSLEGMNGRLFRIHIAEAEGLAIQHGETLEAPIPEGSVRLLPRSDLANDLDLVYQRFFTDIAGDNDPEMLAKCFVESRESREADDSLGKIARDLINQVEQVNPSASKLQAEIRDAVESNRGEFVLITGHKGAGKSTFVDRFFRLVLERDLRKRCLVLRVNLANSTGDISTIVPWLTSSLIEELESGMFEDGIPTYNELKGVFYREYRRWQVGEFKVLYETQEDQFKIRFGEWMYRQKVDDPDHYLRCLLKSVYRQRKMMPCVVFDNTDQHLQEFQDIVFQFAQSLFRSVFCFILVPITDRTIWRLGKHGPIQSYSHRTFYLPVPSTKEVISKRVTFLREKVSESREGGHYFLEHGISVRISNIEAFAICIEKIFLEEEYIARIVGWLSNHDIRRSLKITERILTSPVIEISELVGAHMLGKPLSVRRREIKKALVKGQHSHYLCSQSDFVLNLFQVSPERPTSPLLRLSVLRLLLDKDHEEGDPREAYLSCVDMIAYFDPMGVDSSRLYSHLQALVDFRLVHPYDPTQDAITDDLMLRIAPAGRIHYEFAFAHHEGSYMTEMALTTAVRDQALVAYIRGKLDSGRMAYNDWRELQSTFVGYLLHVDRAMMTVPENKRYEGQKALRTELHHIWDVDEALRGQQSLDL